jgi:hypothetical protein
MRCHLHSLIRAEAGQDAALAPTHASALARQFGPGRSTGANAIRNLRKRSAGITDLLPSGGIRTRPGLLESKPAWGLDKP